MSTAQRELGKIAYALLEGDRRGIGPDRVLEALEKMSPPKDRGDVPDGGRPGRFSHRHKTDPKDGDKRGRKRSTLDVAKLMGEVKKHGTKGRPSYPKYHGGGGGGGNGRATGDPQADGDAIRSAAAERPGWNQATGERHKSSGSRMKAARFKGRKGVGVVQPSARGKDRFETYISEFDRGDSDLSSYATKTHEFGTIDDAFSSVEQITGGRAARSPRRSRSRGSGPVYD